MIKKNDIDRLLIKSARKLSLHDILTVLTGCICYFLTVHLIYIYLDHKLLFSPFQRQLAFLITFLPPILLLTCYLTHRLSKKMSLIYVAKQIESNNPDIDNQLVSHLMSRQNSNSSKERIIDLLNKTNLNHGSFPKALFKYLKFTSLILFASLLYSIISLKSVPLSLARLYAPLANAPMPSATVLAEIEPPNGAEVFIENKWQVKVKYTGLEPKNGFVKLYNSDNNFEIHELQRTKNGDFIATLPATGNTSTYSIILGDGDSGKRTVNFIRKPLIKDFSTRINPPSYLGNYSLTNKEKNFSATKGSTISFDIQFDQKITDAEIFWEGKAIPLLISFDRVYCRERLVINGSGEYFLRVKSPMSDEFHDTPKFKVTAKEDFPPTAKILTPENEQTFRINDNIEFVYTCEDDIALKSVTLHINMRYSGVKKTFTLHDIVNHSTLSDLYTIPLKSLDIAEDDILIAYLTASDYRLGNAGKSFSNTIKLNIKASSQAITDEFNEQKDYGKPIEPPAPNEPEVAKSDEGASTQELMKREAPEKEATETTSTDNEEKTPSDESSQDTETATNTEPGEGNMPGKEKGDMPGETPGEGEGQGEGQPSEQANAKGQGQGQGDMPSETPGEGEGQGESQLNATSSSDKPGQSSGSPGKGGGSQQIVSDGKGLEKTEVEVTNNSQMKRLSKEQNFRETDSLAHKTEEIQNDQLQELPKIDKQSTPEIIDAQEIDSEFKIAEVELEKKEQKLEEEAKGEDLNEFEREVVREFKKELLRLNKMQAKQPSN
jgi:hypothetical protein